MTHSTVKVVVASAAVAAAGAMAPAVQADTGGPIAAVAMNGNTTVDDYDTSLVLKSALVTMDMYGVPVNLGCTSGSASGDVHAGSPAPPRS